MRLWLSVCSVVCSLLVTSAVSGQVTVESPYEGASLSGIGLISGWACRAESIEVRFNRKGGQTPVVYGSDRGDTRAVCGDTNNGFSILFNWNILGAGDHTVEVFVDGRVQATRTVTVVNYGEEFLQGVDGEWTIEDWPTRGTDTVIAWNESLQNVEIVDILRAETPPPPQNDLRALLGSWRFTHSRGTDEFTFTRIQTGSTGMPIAVGTAGAGRYLMVGSFTTAVDEDYAVLWKTPSLCKFYVFD